MIHRCIQGEVQRTSEKYVCPHSGTWLVQYFRFHAALP